MSILTRVLWNPLPAATLLALMIYSAFKLNWELGILQWIMLFVASLWLCAALLEKFVSAEFDELA